MSGSPARLRALVVEDERPAREYLVEILSACDTTQVVAAVAKCDAGVRVPVVRDRAQSVREALLRGAAGVQRRLVP